ncbi:oligoendopeptidase F [Bacillus sp. 165]|uniref:oligoendopeptidase F n=1 Tax=Bacillus sp. 165 TaxID=1529117 RepID=UPI001ADB64EB|nr:oligoendopeptidase F [Bacillus sp. 165]MBO9129244.1 oligoendopeptidase F [Bacillus sp. 165]
MKIYTSRQEVPVSETWNLTDIYKNEEAWTADYRLIAEKIEQLKVFAGTIDDGHSLFRYLKLREDVSYLYSKVYAYAQLQLDIDTRVATSQAFVDQTRQLGQKISSATSFFMPFLLSLSEKILQKYIHEVKELTYFEDDLLEAYRYKEHVLSKEKEEVLSEMGEALSSPAATFGMINNADIQFGEVTDENGQKISLTRGLYAKLIEHEDREKRKEAYKAYYKPYIQLQNTIASTLSSSIKNNVRLSSIRNYPSALEKSLFTDMVPKEVYENLIQSTKKHIEPLHRYTNIRKKRMGLTELCAFDLNVPLVQGMKQVISYEEAYNIMLDSLLPLGEEYVQTLQSFKEKRYIDVRETPGKRSGAYNFGLYGVHPFVLLNHRDDLDSLFTLTHEMGHAMHSYYSSTYQPRIKAGYSIFVAEVASTVNEVLLIRYLLNQTNEERMKTHLLNHFIDQFKGTFFTQVMFAEFEKITHEKAESGEALNASVFNTIYESLYREYNGDSIHFDEEVQYGWARIPHFYRPFYVYKYATGFASAIHIADKLLEGDEEMLRSYLTFLKSGSSDYPLVLLQQAGVDLSKPEPIQTTLTMFGDLVDTFAKMQ